MHSHQPSLALLSMLLAIAAVSCADSTSFSGVSNSNPAPAQPPKEGAQLPAEVSQQDGKQTDKYTLKIGAGKLDMVWIIDNSGSMAGAVANVRKNFAAFIAQVENFSDFKLGLISAATVPANTALQLPQTAVAKGHTQFDVNVGSTNPLAILAAALCPLAQSDALPAVNKICNQTLVTTPPMEGTANVNVARGVLQGFFRPNSKQVFVFVTDDDNRAHVNDVNFLSMTAQSNPSKPLIFAFRGVAATADCTISRPGLSYERLATATGGQVFDVCAPDWTSSFAKLTERSKEFVAQDFTLSKTPKSILRVLVDGKEIDKNSVKVSGNKVTVSSLPTSATAGSNSALEIEYN